MASADDKHPFLMEVKDEAGNVRTIEVVARGGTVVISDPTRWEITLTPDQGDTLSPVIQGASNRARKQKTP